MYVRGLLDLIKANFICDTNYFPLNILRILGNRVYPEGIGTPPPPPQLKYSSTTLRSHICCCVQLKDVFLFFALLIIFLSVNQPLFINSTYPHTDN